MCNNVMQNMHKFCQKMKHPFISLNTKQVEWNQNIINKYITGSTRKYEIIQNKVKQIEKKENLNCKVSTITHNLIN